MSLQNYRTRLVLRVTCPLVVQRLRFTGGFPSSMTAALRSVAESATFDAAGRNRAFVLMQFFGYLQRDPSSTPRLLRPALSGPTFY